ncbi:hypothetical protein PCASD_18700 [Puccinia coronata f. sp. avenae]|uniref:Uncharacterized protein n=1 Tax=Puccinia coronata f. sp. avenae TaxID=200324 RepID=A0A2N5U0T2_9BASI|nr:hypothetical protein PCASD_18700 [Puccinia coronata f. sp. avenae]
MLPVLFSGVGKVAGGGAKRREEELAPPLGGVNNARLIAGASLGMIEDDVGWFWVGRALPSSETFGPKVNPVWFRESGGKPTKGGTGEPALYMLSNQSLEYVRWAACGFSNADEVAALFSSTRTLLKHFQENKK